MPVVVPELADTCVVLNGVAKTYAMTGWRVGWMVGPKDAVKLAANLQSHLSSNVNNIAQRAALAALTGPQTEAEDFRLAFDRRRRLIVSELAKIEGVTVPNPTGAFYVYPDVQGLLGREWRGKTPTTSLELADLILDEVEVAVQVNGKVRARLLLPPGASEATARERALADAAVETYENLVTARG